MNLLIAWQIIINCSTFNIDQLAELASQLKPKQEVKLFICDDYYVFGRTKRRVYYYKEEK